MRIGNALLVAGLLLVVVGSIVRFDGRSSRVYIPISSMLGVSVVISVGSP